MSTLWSSSSSNRLASDGMSDLASSAVSGHRLLSAAISNSSSSFSVSRLVVETSQTTAPTYHAHRWGRGGRVPAHFLHGSLGLVAAKPLHVRQGLEEHTAEGVWCEQPHGGGREKRQQADVLGELGLSLLLHCSRLLSMLQKNGDLRVEQAVCILEI